MTTNLSLEMGKTLSNADLNAILTAAEEVISALAGVNEDVHRDNSTKMCALWDDLNDRHAPPAVVKSVVLELLARREASKDPVAFINGAWTLVYYRPPKEMGLKIADKLYAAPPLQAVTLPDEVTFEQAMLEVHGLSPAEAFQKAWSKLRGEMLKSVTNEP